MLSSSNILSFGMPLFDIPTIGSKTWDGSRWTSRDLSSYYDGTYRFDVFGEGGLDSPGLSTGFGDAAGLAGTSSLAGDRAADAMVGSFGQAAVGAGAKAGLGMAFGMSPSDALAMGAQSLASLGTLGGIVGAGINAGLGLSSLGPTQAALAGLAGVLGGPLAAAAVAAFGGFATNALADAFDARDQEQIHDLAEDAYGHTFTGYYIGKDMADTVNSAIANGAGFGGVGLAGAQAAADAGLAGTVSGALAAAAAAQAGSFGPDAQSMGTVSPSTMAGIMGMGVLGGLAQKGLVGEESMALAAKSAPASTTTQGGEDNSPSADIGSPDSAIGAIAGAMAADAAATQSLGDTVSSAVANAQAAAAEAEAMGNAADSDTGEGDPGDPHGGMGDPAADGLNGADPGDTGPDGFGSSDPGAAGVGSGSVGGL